MQQALELFRVASALLPLVPRLILDMLNSCWRMASSHIVRELYLKEVTAYAPLTIITLPFFVQRCNVVHHWNISRGKKLCMPHILTGCMYLMHHNRE